MALYPFWFWINVVRRAIYIITERKRQTALAMAIVQQREESFQGRFVAATAKKIAVSHGIYNPMICDAFARLHGRKTTAAEQCRLVDYFTCSSLFDDFTDYPNQTDEELWQMSFAEDAYEPKNFDQRVFQHCHKALKSFVVNKQAYQDRTHKLFRAQMRSRNQDSAFSDVAIPHAELQEITFAKGGLSVLLCSQYMDEPRTPAEEDCWYTIGTIIQLTNDLFDIYKDLKEGIHTLPNQMQSPWAFEQFFLGRIASMKRRIVRLPVSHKTKQAFSLDMAGIYSFGLIALHQLKALAPEGAEINFSKLTRKQLIVDMEKPSNLLRWFRFVYAHARL